MMKSPYDPKLISYLIGTFFAILILVNPVMAAQPFIRIDTIGDHNFGDKFTISATTNLAENDEVLVQVFSTSYKPNKSSLSGEFNGATGTVKVAMGDGGLNKIRFYVDSSKLKPDQYIVNVQAVIQDTTSTAQFTLHESVEPVAVTISDIKTTASTDTMFRANPLHTGVFDTEGILHTNNEQWRFATGGVVSSSPAVSNGVVYVGSYDKNLYAIDAITGKEQWRFATGGAVSSSPAVSNGVVYVGSYDKNLYAIDAITGKEQWKFATGSGVFSSPVILDGVVYIGSDDKDLYAIDTVTGKEKWRFETGSDIFSSPAVSNGIVYVGSYDTNLYAIDTVTGKEKWRFKTRSYVSSSPAVWNGIVYVGSYDTNLYAIDAATGKEKWRFATGGAVRSSPAVSNGIVYVGSYDTNLYAIDAVTGKEKWRFKTGNYIDSSPAVSNNLVFGGSLDGNLYAIEAVNGKEKWQFNSSGGVYSSPAVSKGVVYIGSYDTNVYAVGGTQTSSISIPTIAPSMVPTITVMPSPSIDPCLSSSDCQSPDFTSLIIVFLTVLFLSSGGYVIYWVKRKYYGIDNLLRRISLVEQKASKLTLYQSLVQEFISAARKQYQSGEYRAVKISLDTAEDAISNLAPFETLFRQWNSEGYVTAFLETVKTDNINTITSAFQKFEQDLITLKKYEGQIQELKRSCSTGNVDPSITQHIGNIASQLHDPRNISRIGREIEMIEQQILRDQQERTEQQKRLRDQNEKAKQRQDTEQLFSRLHEKLEKLPHYASLITDSFAKARDQITSEDYDNAQKTLRLVEEPIDALLQCESLLAVWEVKDYNLLELEAVKSHSIDEVLRVYQKTKQNINRLESITQDLESKKIAYPFLFEQPEIAVIISSLESKLRSPTAIDAVEIEYRKLNETIRRLDEKQKLIEQNLRYQVEQVQREVGSPAIKEEIASISKIIQQGDITRAKEMLKALAEKQLSQANTALSKLPEGVVISISSHSIREQLAAENYGDAIIGSEKVSIEIKQILDEKQKLIEQNLRYQVEQVQREVGSPAIKEEIASIAKIIQQGDITRAKEMLKALAEKQLSQANTALSTLQAEGAVIAISSELIREQIAAEKYGDALLDSEKVIKNLILFRDTYTKAKIMKSTVLKPEILALFDNGNYEEFIRAGEEQQILLLKVVELKEKGSNLLGKAELFGLVPKHVRSNLEAEDVLTLESAIRELETFSLTAKPELILSLDRTQLSAGEWHRVEIQIKNIGSAHSVDVNLSFSDDFDTRWLEPLEVEGGKTAVITSGILPKKKGNIPLEISCSYKDKLDKPYQQKFRFWIDVVDRMSMTPEAGVITPPQSPVSRFAPRPLTLKQLPPDLSERYTESEFIGKGGFARVFKAKRKDGKNVAVKIPISMDASTGKSFITEMQNWIRFNHPNIVKLYDFNIMPMPYFEMELCDSSLAPQEKPIECEEAAWILFNVCEGLKYAHSLKIIHRDLKPQNILLKNGVPKISDWGLSRVISESTSTTTTSFTPYYAAPEQISSDHKDERTDIWQLGVIFYELVTGQLPFTGDSMVAIMGAIVSKNPPAPSLIVLPSQSVEAVIMKCLQKNPDKRYQSVLELQKDLALYLRVTYTESLKLSVTVGDIRRSSSYCGDLVMVNLLTGDMNSAYKYLLEFIHYSKGDLKADAQELSEQIKMRMDMGLTEIPDELIQKAEVIVHQVNVGFRKRG